MLKFIWSIFVEKFHSKNYGKCRSLVVPLQILTAGVMVAVSNWLEARSHSLSSPSRSSTSSAPSKTLQQTDRRSSCLTKASVKWEMRPR